MKLSRITYLVICSLFINIHLYATEVLTGNYLYIADNESTSTEGELVVNLKNTITTIFAIDFTVEIPQEFSFCKDNDYNDYCYLFKKSRLGGTKSSWSCGCNLIANNKLRVIIYNQNCSCFTKYDGEILRLYIKGSEKISNAATQVIISNALASVLTNDYDATDYDLDSCPSYHYLYFVDSDGSALKTFYYNKDATIGDINFTPTKIGYFFNGWDKEIPTIMPNTDITITAKWTPYFAYVDATGEQFTETFANGIINLNENIKSITIYNKDNINNINYTRTFNKTKWQSLYIPFSLKYSDWSEDFEIAYINGIRQFDNNDDGTIDETIMDIIKIKNGSTKPNTPYLIKAKSTGEKTLKTEDATLCSTDEKTFSCSTMTTQYNFTGTYSTIPASTLLANNYYTMGDGSLIMTDGTSDLKPFRWYLSIEARDPMYNNEISLGAKSIIINVLDDEVNEATGISEINASSQAASSIYDLNGRKMTSNALKSGLYIKNGKKYIVK